MNRRIFWITFGLFAVVLAGVLSFDESRVFIVALVLRILVFVKKNIFKILATFFLVKGKFILTLFLKKLALLSFTGLGKRYVVEKVVLGNVKTHFLDHLSDDFKRLIKHAKENFKSFPLVKKVITIFIFLGSLGFVGKFMGGMLAIKVFVAKVWSFLLAIFLKVSSAVVYFFSDYLWSSWLAPIVEVVIFSWLLSVMEKVPFLQKGLQRIYTFFVAWFGWIEYYLQKVFHSPIKRFLKWFVQKIQRAIYKFIGYKKVSKWKRLQEGRILNPNSYHTMINKRKLRHQNSTKNRQSNREKLLAKRQKEPSRNSYFS